jgi:hypothetical protein
MTYPCRAKWPMCSAIAVPLRVEHPRQGADPAGVRAVQSLLARVIVAFLLTHVVTRPVLELVEVMRAGQGGQGVQGAALHGGRDRRALSAEWL